MTAENLARNLRYLCERKQSVSQICRQLGFNRQQFGRYLTGKNRPSMYNLTRICQYFNVSIDDIVLPHARFRERLSQLPGISPLPPLPDGLVAELMNVAEAATTDMDAYVGHYFWHHFSLSFPDFIFKSFFAIQKVGRFYYTKHIERIPADDTPIGTSLIIKYDGIMMNMNSRLFLIERMTSVQRSISQTIYAPIFRPGRRYLSGVGCSLSTSSENHPSAARSVLEYVGNDANPRAMLKSCGLFRPGSSAVSPYILSMLESRGATQDPVFQAHRG